MRNSRKGSGLTHWTCPHCGVIIPNYKDSWDSISLKVQSHLKKFHPADYSMLDRQQVNKDLWERYKGNVDPGQSINR